MTRGILAWIVLAIFAVQIGCGKVGGYPETTVRSPVGREGVCISCGKTIASVSKQNLTTSSGIQFIVCSQACAEKAGEAAEGHSHEHSH